MKKNGSTLMNFESLSRLTMSFFIVALLLGVLSLVRHTQASTLLPDMVVQSITVDPLNPMPGQPFTVTIVVNNRGTADATIGGKLYFYANPTDNPPVLGETGRTSLFNYGISLPVGGTFIYHRTGQKFDNAGRYPLYAWIDVDGQVAESNEAGTGESNNLFGPVYVTVGEPIPGEDGYEPDNDCANNTMLTDDGVEQVHNLMPFGDVDYVAFDAVAGATYHFEAIADGAEADLAVEIESSCGLPGSFGSGVNMTFSPTTNGKYYIKIYNNSVDPNATDTAYRVRLNRQSTCPNYHEPDNSCLFSSSISADGVAQTHDFCEANDQDWTALPVTGGTKYKVELKNIGAEADGEIELYSSCLELPLGLPDNTTGTTAEFIASESGTLFIRTANNYTKQNGANTEYSLSVTNEGDGCVADSFEQDDSADTAKPYTTLQTHNFCPQADRDWVSFDPIAGKKYNIDTIDLAASADTVICLHDTVGNTIDCNDDFGGGINSHLVYEASTSDRVMIEVRGFNEAVSGPDTEYTLQITEAEANCQVDNFEPDNLSSQPSELSFNTPQDHNFCRSAARGDNDVDHAQIAITQSGTYLFKTFDLESNSDTLIELWDAQGNLIDSNDDFASDSLASQLVVQLNPGTYILSVRPFNGSSFGIGTGYRLQVEQQIVDPTPTAVPTVVPTPVPTVVPTPVIIPPPDAANTLILVNESRMLEEGFAATEVDLLMNKLSQLANLENVRGEILRLDQNSDVVDAYAGWDETTEIANIEHANRIANAIRNVVVQRVEQNPALRYLVIVGNDPIIPFYRQPDRTGYPENTYNSLNSQNSGTGFALKNNYYLTNDGYGDLDPLATAGGFLFVPDLAIGRLIETPAEIISFIDNFIVNPHTDNQQILVVGYDFVADVAEQSCNDWKNINQGVTECLIRDYNAARYRELINANAYAVRAIANHANHFNEGVPGGAVSATMISDAKPGYGLAYSIGCHSGLNNPSASDLAETYLRLGYNYIGNTGYGWGSSGGIVLSERLMQYYTRGITSGAVEDIGSALVHAKKQYYQQTGQINNYDQKVLEQWILYGLPNFGIHLQGSLASFGNEFPSADFSTSTIARSRATSSLMTKNATLNLSNSLTQVTSDDGTRYYTLDGHAQRPAFAPVQPTFYGDVTDYSSNLALHGVVFEGGSYKVDPDFSPYTTVPTNEYTTDPLSPPITVAGWQPELPVTFRQEGGKAHLIATLGQYNGLEKIENLFNSVNVKLYYSDSSDDVIPVIHNQIAEQLTDTIISIKVGVTDQSAVERVVVAYTDGNNNWKSADLTFDATRQKWVGQFQVASNFIPSYIVQAVDSSGNVAYATNKGSYYKPLTTVPVAIQLQSAKVENHAIKWSVVLLITTLLLALMVRTKKGRP